LKLLNFDPSQFFGGSTQNFETSFGLSFSGPIPRKGLDYALTLDPNVGGEVWGPQNFGARGWSRHWQPGKASPTYNLKYFYSFFGIIFQFYFLFLFLTEAAQYECSYRRTAHHATALAKDAHKEF